MKKLLSFKAIDGKFGIGDKKLSDDLAEIITKTKLNTVRELPAYLKYLVRTPDV